MALSTYVLAFFCESLHMVPFLILAFFPFYQQLRMPALLCVVSQFMQSAFYLYLTYHHQSLRPTDYVFPFFCFIIYFGCIKADFWKHRGCICPAPLPPPGSSGCPLPCCREKMP